MVQKFTLRTIFFFSTHLLAVSRTANDDGLVLQVALQTGLSKVAAHARVLEASKRSVALRQRQSERD